MGGPNYHPSLTDGSLDRRTSAARAEGAKQSDGDRLATIQRKDGAEELRIEAKSYNGYPYFDLRVWFKGDGGEWRPTKTGVTIRPRELDEVIAVLSKARGG